MGREAERPRARRGGPGCRSPCCSPRRTRDGGRPGAPSGDRARSSRSPTRRRSSDSSVPSTIARGSGGSDRAGRPPAQVRVRASRASARSIGEDARPADVQAVDSRARSRTDADRQGAGPHHQAEPAALRGAKLGVAQAADENLQWGETRRAAATTGPARYRGRLFVDTGDDSAPACQNAISRSSGGGGFHACGFSRRPGDDDAPLLADPRCFAGERRRK